MSGWGVRWAEPCYHSIRSEVPNMMLECNKYMMIFFNWLREIHEQESCLRKLLRMSDILQGTDKGWTWYALLALSIHIHPLLHAPYISGAGSLTTTFLRLPCCQGSGCLLWDLEDEIQMEVTFFFFIAMTGFSRNVFAVDRLHILLSSE